MFDLYKIDAQGVHYPSREAIQERMAKAIALDADGKIWASLVNLGWTPPQDNRDVTDAVQRAEDAAGMWCVRDVDGGLAGSFVPEILAAEVRRLRLLFRVNMLRHAPSATHAEIDKLLYPELPEQPV